MGNPAVLRPLESDAQSTIVELARWLRWRSYHTFDSRRSAGGYPDLTLVRDRVVFAELKRAGEKPRSDQIEWLTELATAGMEVYVWTLDDLNEIRRVLERQWRFVPFGESTQLSDTDLAGPRVVDDAARVSFAPRSAWIPGHGRRN